LRAIRECGGRKNAPPGARVREKKIDESVDGAGNGNGNF